MGVVVFNGVSSKDYGIEVETFPTYEIPEREYESIHVPGRNGDVIIDNGTYKNVSGKYKVSIATWDKISYSQKMAGVAKWLHSSSGYARLEDSYAPEIYRMAYYNKALSIENLFNQAGRGTIEFICKPQRFLKSGEFPVEFTGTGKIQNRTDNIALPKILVTTDDTVGTVTVGAATVSIAAGAGTNIILDSELQDAYTALGANKNSVVTLQQGMFPVLYPGENIVAITGGVTKIEIIPNWWII